MNEILEYSPNKSKSYGQALYPKKINKALKQVHLFLEKYTNHEVFGKIEIHIQLMPNNGDDINEFRNNTTTLLGSPNEVNELSENNSMGYVIWHIDSSKIDQVKLLIESNERILENTINGRISIAINYLFMWKNEIIDCNQPLGIDGENSKFQDLKLMLTIYIQKNPFVQPLLFFPLSFSDKKNWDILKTIFNDIPFKVNLNDLKTKTISKNSKSFKTRKIDKELIEEFKEYK